MADVENSEFHFTIPPEGRENITLYKQPKVAVSTESFTTLVPPILHYPCLTVLENLERIDAKIWKLIGAEKNLLQTDLRIYIRGIGGRADYGGHFLATIFDHLFFSADQPLNGLVTHERSHNYGQYHGGRMELIDEGSKVEGRQYVTPVLYCWEFTDMMNGIVPREANPNHFLKGLYFYTYNKIGPELIQLVYRDEPSVVSQMETFGFDEFQSQIALLSVYAEEDFFSIGKRLGHFSSRSGYNAALRQVRTVLGGLY